MDPARHESARGGILTLFFMAGLGFCLGACDRPAPGKVEEAPEKPALFGARVITPEPADEDGQWMMPPKTYASLRYSGLREINAGNVRELKLAWSFSTGVERGHEAAPLVVGETMYVVTPYPNYLYALDLTKPGPAVKWTFTPEPSPRSQGAACCDVVNRGAAFANGRIYFNTLDNYTIAVDAETGAEVWKTKLGDAEKGESMTMAPLVVKGKVLVGNSSADLGVRGWLTALDEGTGAVAWRAGAAGGWISYDPELDLLYSGTASPGTPELRDSTKWTAGILARRPDTGEAIWSYSWSPRDPRGYDGMNESLLLDFEIAGQTRKVLVHPSHNGHMYVVDRATGEVLSAEPFGAITTSKGVDIKTAFSPQTGLLYIPHQNPGQDPGGHRGLFQAWDPAAAKSVWRIIEKFPVRSGTVATSGELAFYGTMDGWFKAAHARTGEVLWQYKTDSGIVSQPITFEGPDGKHYVAVLSGVGGAAGDIAPRNPTAAKVVATSMQDLPQPPKRGGTLYVFGVP